jgi:hypothetical protein
VVEIIGIDTVAWAKQPLSCAGPVATRPWIETWCAQHERVDVHGAEHRDRCPFLSARPLQAAQARGQNGAQAVSAIALVGSRQRAAEVLATQYGDWEGSKTGVKLASRFEPRGNIEMKTPVITTT